MEGYVLLKKGERDQTRSCTDEETRLLQTAEPKSAYMALISSLHDARLDVRCPCNIRWRVVNREHPQYIRREEGQELGVAESCKLCLRIRHRINSGERPAPRPIRSMLIPFDSSDSGSTSADLPDSGTGGGDSSLYIPTPYGVAAHILHEAGLGNWENYNPTWPLAEWNLFSRIRDVLDRHPVSPRVDLSSKTSWLYFSAVPGRPGNLGEVARRLRANWPDRSLPYEAWVIGFVDHIVCHGNNRTFSVSRILDSLAHKIHAKGETNHGPYIVSLDSEFVTAPVTRGPYIAFVVYTFEKGVPVNRARLVERNAVLHAIASKDLACPVDSHIERLIIRLFRKFGEPFIKELVKDGEGRRLDFILPPRKLLLEVNGMLNFELYAASKARVWPRVCSLLRLQDLEKVQFEVRGEPDERELLRILNSRTDSFRKRNR